MDMDELTLSKGCGTCKAIKPLEDFNRSRNAPDGRDWRCKECSYSRLKIWKQENPDKVYLHEVKRRHGGITKAELDDMLAAQEGACAICGSTDPGSKRRNFSIDHDHKCCPKDKSCVKCRRGLLCGVCNSSLGGFRDDPELLRKAADYIEKWNANHSD